MIKIVDQIACKFSIGDIEDFISPNNLHEFVLYETAGNLRPVIELTFTIENTKLINYLNPGNILRVSFGINEPSKDVIQFELFGDNTDREVSFGYTTTIKASLYIPKFTSLEGCSDYKNKTSLEVIKEIANKHKFNLHTNITRTNDRQNWERTGKTEWQYMHDLWKHSYINDDTFTVFAFDADNMYFYDVKQLVKSGSKWLFTNKYQGSVNSNIVNIGGYKTQNIYGKLNDLVGKNSKNTTFNFDNSNIFDTTYKLKTFSTIDTNKLNLNINNCLQHNYSFITDDVHANYVKAAEQNIRNNIMYSSFIISLSTAGQFKKLRLFDTVSFDLEPKDNRLDGIAFITSITYQYVDRHLVISLILNKESPSGIKSTNLKIGD